MVDILAHLLAVGIGDLGLSAAAVGNGGLDRIVLCLCAVDGQVIALPGCGGGVLGDGVFTGGQAVDADLPCARRRGQRYSPVEIIGAGNREAEAADVLAALVQLAVQAESLDNFQAAQLGVGIGKSHSLGTDGVFVGLRIKGALDQGHRGLAVGEVAGADIAVHIGRAFGDGISPLAETAYGAAPLIIRAERHGFAEIIGAGDGEADGGGAQIFRQARKALGDGDAARLCGGRRIFRPGAVNDGVGRDGKACRAVERYPAAALGLVFGPTGKGVDIALPVGAGVAADKAGVYEDQIIFRIVIAVSGKGGQTVGQTGPLIADMVKILFHDLIFIHLEVQALMPVADVNGFDEVILALESELQVVPQLAVDGDIAGQDHFGVLGHTELGPTPLITGVVFKFPVVYSLIVSFAILHVNRHSGVRDGDGRLHAVYGKLSGHTDINMVEIGRFVVNSLRVLHGESPVCVGRGARGKHRHDHQYGEKC